MIKKLLSTVLVAAALVSNAQQVQNPGFETWSNSFPTGWGSIGQLLVSLAQPNPGTETQTTTAHSGTYAVLLTNENVPIAGGVIPGLVVTGPVTLAGSSIALGRQTYTAQPSSYTFYFEYAPISGDTAFSQVIFSKWNGTTRDTLGTGGVLITGTVASYSMMTAPINWTTIAAPDSIQLLFASSIKPSSTCPVGSMLYVDDVNMVVNTTSVQTLTANGTFANAYPNPANSAITIMSANENAKYAKVYDLTGRLINTYELNNKFVKVDLSSYENGLYIYTVTDDQNNFINTSKFNVAK